MQQQLHLSTIYTADGDLTGRTVTFANNSKGLVVAHRHPIAFVLLDKDDATTTSASDATTTTECSISTKLVSVEPESIPSGSTVDYLGRHVTVLKDGSVGRTLPRASSSSSATSATTSARDTISVTIPGITDMNDDTASTSGNNKLSRPIFVPIPKISDIGLIDSPLVTGITAVDALTPIGKGQNMLVIGNQEPDDVYGSSSGGVNKRGWMVNLLKSVVENSRSNSSGDGSEMRCFYGLTLADGTVRSNMMTRLERAGIQDDVVTVVSTRDGTASDGEGDDAVSNAQTLVAAEAVAVAATACTLGEHHALTTGGDSLVIIDDINLHKNMWDITTQFLVQVYGVDAVVKADLQGGSSSEMRGYFSGLIQRAARFNAKKGGGSVTLILLSTLPGEDDLEHDNDEPVFDPSDFDSMSDKIQTRIAMLVKAKVPLTPTNLRKIQIPLPRPSKSEDAKRLALQHVEDLISMSDGQIWFDDKLAESGRSPPLDPSMSMTRVGVGADTRTCRADAPALRSVVGSLRFEFQQAMDMMESNSSASSTTSSTVSSTWAGGAKQVQRRDAFLLAMHQEPNESRKLSHECIALLAAARGHLDGVLQEGGKAGTPEGKDAIDGLMAFIEKKVGEVVNEIDTTLDLSLEGRHTLENAIENYFVK